MKRRAHTKLRPYGTMLLIVAGLALGAAKTASAGAGWTNFGEITEFNQYPPASPGNEMVFVTTTATTNPSGCSTGTVFYFAVTQESHKRMFAMLLAAKMAGKRVMLYVTGTCHAWGSEVAGVNVE